MDRPYRPDRDSYRDNYRDRNRDRDDRDRNRDDRDFRRQSRRPSAFSDAPPDHNQFPPDRPRPHPHTHNSPPHRPRPDHGGSPRARFSGSGPGPGPLNPPPDYRGGFSSGDYRPEDLWAMRGSGPGFGTDFPPQHPPFHQLPIPQPSPPQLSGQKRGFSDRGGGSPEKYDGRSLVKLFVGSVPRTVTEEEVRPCFEEHGKVLEVALIKDKRSGQQQGCCFIKYATTEEADRAIRALHNQYTLPGGVGPIQVRYADGERERLGNVAVEHKLYVGSLNKYSTEKEVEEIFLPYGRIDDVYLLRDERKQSKGCGFVKYANKDSAVAAANALHGIYTMRGCNQPLIVRFAEPKKLRPAEPRAGSAFEGPGPGPSPSPGIRPVPGSNLPDAKGNQRPPNAWQPLNSQSMGPSPSADGHGFGNGFPSRPGEAPISSIASGYNGVQGGNREGSFPASSTSSQNLNQSYPQAPSSGQQISPLQSSFQPPQQFPPALQLHQGPGSYGQVPNSQPPPRPLSQMQSGTIASYSQPFQSHQFQSLPGGQLPSDQFQVQQNAAPVTTQPRPNTSSSLTNPQLATPSPQQTPYQQSPSQLAQMLSQQTHSLQASFQSSQQTLSHLQQQLQMMQPSTQNQPLRQSFQASEKQSQWAGAVPTVATNARVGPTRDAPPPMPLAPAKCNWTEHTSPDGYKYYYNSSTGESKWEKPDELKLYEQQHKSVSQQTQPQAQHNRQDMSNQQVAQTQPSQLQTQFFVDQHRSVAPQTQPQAQHNRQDISNQQVAQSQPSQLQTQFRSANHLHHPPLLSNYPASQGLGNQTAQEKTYSQSLTPANSVTGPATFQQGLPAAQDWAWSNSRGN